MMFVTLTLREDGNEKGEVISINARYIVEIHGVWGGASVVMHDGRTHYVMENADEILLALQGQEQ